MPLNTFYAHAQISILLCIRQVVPLLVADISSVRWKTFVWNQPVILFFFRLFFFYFMFYSAQLEALVREGGHGLLLAWTQMNLICPGHWLDSCQCPTGSSLVTGLSFDLGEKSIGREMSYQDFPHTLSHADENYTDVCQQANLRTEKSPTKPKLDR